MRPRAAFLRVLAGCMGTVVSASAGGAQAVPRDTLRLAALQEAAVRRDPRGRQLELLAGQAELRLRNLDAERLPSLAVAAQGQYQSDVPSVPFQLPGGVTRPTPPNDTYDANVGAEQRLFDPTLGARRAVERAQLAESQARVRSALYDVRRSELPGFLLNALRP